MKLYYCPNTRAVRARWLLEELGIDHEVVRVDMRAGEHKTDTYKHSVHPLGRVPALIEGEMGIFESGAICQYLADKFLERGFAPSFDAADRGRYLQWMAFSTATLEPAVIALGMARAKKDEEAVAKAQANLDEISSMLADHLTERQYLLGDQFSAADVMNGSILGWAKSSGMLDDYPHVLTYAARVTSRPAALRARAD